MKTGHLGIPSRLQYEQFSHVYHQLDYPTDAVDATLSRAAHPVCASRTFAPSVKVGPVVVTATVPLRICWSLSLAFELDLLERIFGTLGGADEFLLVADLSSGLLEQVIATWLTF